MPSVGPTEILLVLVIALLVLGPTRLPQIGRQLGRSIREFRNAARTVTREMGAEDLVDDLRELNQARGTFGETVRKELGLDDLGAFPDISDVVDPKPVAVDAPSPAGAATAAAPAAASPGVVADPQPAGPVDGLPDEAPATGTSEPAAPKPARKRAPRAKTAEADVTPPESVEAASSAAPKPVRKRTPRAKAAPAADAAPEAAVEAVAIAPAKPRTARTRTAKTSEPA